MAATVPATLAQVLLYFAADATPQRNVLATISELGGLAKNRCDFCEANP